MKYDLLAEDSIKVNFSLNQTAVNVKRFSFTKYSPNLKKDVGRRYQFPLKLCYSVTVHKAQGMTLDRICIDCKNMFQFGQLVVGLSRARKKKGLHILNFSRNCFINLNQL
ncbi:hypothetical protein KUTeg_015046 [Tegillarca granosa]|uniref:ATP-dependent DNA helicase PIF1 n=1 Tax=Tegillarca granosa TaxID=220873 RepID=A0ABQ9ESN2_TEGGR|nr:hypothetical protein KUTeg_015046 [Tegillarca granosa]